VIGTPVSSPDPPTLLSHEKETNEFNPMIIDAEAEANETPKNERLTPDVVAVPSPSQDEMNYYRNLPPIKRFGKKQQQKQQYQQIQ